MLARNGHKVTIIERSPHFRTTGQQIDVAGNGVPICKALGIWDDLLARSVDDKGLQFVDDHYRSWADFKADTENSHDSFVKELEILRGDMAEVLYQLSRDTVEYVLDNTITALDEQDSHVTVTFSNSPQRDFDIVIAADGLKSKTRQLMFGENFEIKSLHMCGAVFSMPWAETDGDWSKWYGATKGRTVTLRPQKSRGVTGAYLTVCTEDSARIARLSKEEQVVELECIFRNLAWETPRVLEAMKKADDLYFLEVAQTFTPIHGSKRFALLGDAGYAPSPVSGQGTTLAYVGAYILAGAICTYDDVPEAMSQYNKMMKPFAKKSQTLIPGVPWIANPQSYWGLKLLYLVMATAGLVIQSGLAGLFSKLFSPLGGWFGDDLPLPSFPKMTMELPEKKG